MSTLSTPARNASLDAVLALLNVGGAGTLQFCTTGFGSVLATLPLSNPAFASAVSGVATANSITPDTNTGNGTVQTYRFRDNAGTTVVSGTAFTSGAEIIVNNAAFTSGGICSVASYTLTQPAS